MSDVCIVGVGIHPFGRTDGISGLDQGVFAVRQALADAGADWEDIQFAYGGSDAAGNRYFTMKRARASGRTPRWVMYAGFPDPTTVPSEWHSWLHYTTDAPLPETGRKPWQKPHQKNMTGSAGSYRPAGHDYQGGNRVAASGDYEAWTPGS